MGGWELDEFRAALARHDVGLVVAGPRFAALRHHHVLEAGVPDQDWVIRSWMADDLG